VDLSKKFTQEIESIENVKQEVFNETISDVEDCLKVDLKYNYEVMNTISYGAKVNNSC
jgi:hypothetical protein